MMPPSSNDKDYVTARELDARFTGIAELIASVKELMAAHFKAVDAKLEPLVRVTDTVDELDRRVSALEAADEAQDVIILELRDGERDRRVFRRDNLPALILSGLSLAVAFLVAVHVGAI